MSVWDDSWRHTRKTVTLSDKPQVTGGMMGRNNEGPSACDARPLRPPVPMPRRWPMAIIVPRHDPVVVDGTVEVSPGVVLTRTATS